MKIVFVSNYINHHQIPFCDELSRLSDNEFTFVQTEPMEEERVNMGWDAGALNQPYVRLYYEEKEALDKLILESDAVIFGGCEDESIIKPRLLSNKFTVRYSERIYKEGRWKFISPRGLKKKYEDHIRFNKNNLYLLCAGAFVKGDFSLIHAYPKKMLKFGYFPKTEIYEDLHEKRRENSCCELLWAARFIDWKHPEMVIGLASRLKAEKISFHISMIGTGNMLEAVKQLAVSKDVSDYITFEGSKSPEQVREMMRKADIYLATSDALEGWGAVINEAMNSGALVIASDKMGATPYLIKDGINGYSFKSKSNGDLYKKVRLALDRENALRMGIRAYETITGLWNSKVAAKRLYEFINDNEHKIPDYEDGPLSKA